MFLNVTSRKLQCSTVVFLGGSADLYTPIASPPIASPPPPSIYESVSIGTYQFDMSATIIYAAT